MVLKKAKFCKVCFLNKRDLGVARAREGLGGGIHGTADYEDFPGWIRGFILRRIGIHF